MSTYAPELKAAAMAALLTGQSVSSVAREYKIPKGTVSGWKYEALAEASGVGPTPTQKEQIGILLLQYLQASIRTLAIQAEHFSDLEWLEKQDASELAVLHGVQTDKAIRLLEALASTNDDNAR